MSPAARHVLHSLPDDGMAQTARRVGHAAWLSHDVALAAFRELLGRGLIVCVQGSFSSVHVLTRLTARFSKIGRVAAPAAMSVAIHERCSHGGNRS